MSQSRTISFDSDEDDILFVAKEASPIPRRKLKRLKRARETPSNNAKESNDFGDPMDYMKSNELESNDQLLKTSSPSLYNEEEEWISQQSSNNSVDEVDKEDEIREKNQVADSDMEKEPHINTNNSTENCFPEINKDNEDLKNPEGTDECVVETTQDLGKAASTPLKKNKNKRRKDSKKNSKSDSKSLNAEEKHVKKKKKSELEMIHAESQRLLRETPDASFKPQPTINKPISSVLEKIRLRKLQLQQRGGKGFAEMSKGSGYEDTSSEEFSEDGHDMGSSDDDEEKDSTLQEQSQFEKKTENSEAANFAAPFNNDNGIPRTPENCGETSLAEKAEKEDTPNTSGGFRAPVEDTQDLFCDSQLSSGEDLEQNPDDSNQDNEDVDPALLSMNLKLDSHPDDDELFDEDDNKENVDPSPSKPAEASFLYSKGAPVKAFVDDEAEDEDEDVLVGQGEEDDSDGDENEDLKDIVATAEEQPQDQSMRDELHRKWLEQQDAAATNDILLRLGGGGKCKGHPTRKTALLNEDDDIAFRDHGDDTVDCDDKIGHHSSDSEESKHENSDSDTEEPPLRTTVDDVGDDDVFVSSEDEEVEERFMRARMLQESEEQEVFLAPGDDETSREIFGLIKKVNIAPNGKKKPKTSSGSGGNSNTSSKSSFLGRTSSTLQTSHKQSLGGSRSYIFGRDDSNSRHSISKTENQEDMAQKENEYSTNNVNKMSSTQGKFKRNKSGNKAAKDANVSGTGPSLFEILRRQTSDMDRTLQSRNTNGPQDNRPANTMSHFAAFRSFTSLKK
ncbi:uncharacterized protein LOC131032564 [Cryptomeria japonica]|uniref:uncharacterized protein LOC131032564 n=1 Tax=Cryptomeria japonica TaxID=3369 RepID=UPI0027DA3CA1|nr:uncharacterized protein LOC131032564 [Cryptomeria japonica]XP_057819567.2 uncharacterized protein LOC131032564 [Cryptomeria japonica]